MPVSDNELMMKFQRGDESAYSALFERHRARVVNTAYRFVGDPDVAQDVAQEVFVRIYTSAKAYRPEAAFTTWLYRITANACLDEIRKRKRSKSRSSSELPESASCPSSSPEDRMQSDELAREVRTAIASLPENQRMAVILQRYEGLSYQQIADVLRVSVPAVESLLSRAKGSLRIRLASYLGDSDQPEPTKPEEKPDMHRRL